MTTECHGLDIARLTDDWFAAVDAAGRGDSRRLADWVERHGVVSAHERWVVAAVLRGEIDARKGPRPETASILDDLDRYKRRRDDWNRMVDDVRARVGRVRQWLLSRPGWDERRIQAELSKRGYDKLRRVTMDDVFNEVAHRHSVEAEAVKQAHHRRLRARRLAEGANAKGE